MGWSDLDLIRRNGESLLERAERHAEIIRRAYQLENEYAPYMPALCERLGIDLHFERLPVSIDGMFFQGKRPHIVINDDPTKPHGRQRYTCAHEIAHHLMTSSREHTLFSMPGHSKDPIERACNVFAANLLMPEESILASFRDLRVYNSDKIVRSLAGMYGVSNLAMENRLLELDLITRNRR